MIRVINFGSTKTPQIVECVSLCGYSVTEKKWQEEWTRDELNETTGIIFSGSPTMFTETDHAPYIDRFAFIREGRIPALGICFGHQFMGLLHGAQIFRGKEIREDITIHVVKEDVLFEGLTPECVMREDHTEGITLPPGFIHLAYSTSYINEGMRHPALPLWGVQFHPEVSGENGSRLIGNFLKNTQR